MRTMLCEEGANLEEPVKKNETLALGRECAARWQSTSCACHSYKPAMSLGLNIKFKS
jgi:hypothetical protein